MGCTGKANKLAEPRQPCLHVCAAASLCTLGVQVSHSSCLACSFPPPWKVAERPWSTTNAGQGSKWTAHVPSNLSECKLVPEAGLQCGLVVPAAAIGL